MHFFLARRLTFANCEDLNRVYKTVIEVLTSGHDGTGQQNIIAVDCLQLAILDSGTCHSKVSSEPLLGEIGVGVFEILRISIRICKLLVFVLFLVDHGWSLKFPGPC